MNNFNIRKIFQNLEKINIKDEPDQVDFDLFEDSEDDEALIKIKDHIVEEVSHAAKDDVIDYSEIDVELKANQLGDFTVNFERRISGPTDQNKFSSNKQVNNLNLSKETNKSMRFDRYKKVFNSKMRVMMQGFSQCTSMIARSFKRIKENYLPKMKKQKVLKTKTTVNNIPKPNFQKLKSNDANLKYLLNIIMGIELTLSATPNIEISNKESISKYLISLKYPVATATLTGAEDIYYIVDHAGILFNNIRRAYGIEKDTFIQSISPKDFITEMMISYTTNIEELISTSKSGSLFYYTRDGKYILKTIPKKEHKFFKSILRDYFHHMIKNRNTLLPKFYGCYKLIRQIKDVKLDKIYFVVMENLFRTRNDIQLRFDLKGSTYKRIVLKKDESIEGRTIDYALKDQDLINNKKFIHLGVST